MDPVCEEAVIDVCEETEKHEYYQAGATIIEQGEASHHAFRLVAGTAKVFKQGDVVATIHPGEYFGSIAALTASKRNATVVASSDCVAQRIEQKRFAAMLQLNPDMLDKIK